MSQATGPETVSHAASEDIAMQSLANLEDCALVRQALANRDEAFETLMDRHTPLLIGYLYKQLRNAADAEDLAQEVFLTSYRSLDQLRDGELFGSWLMRIARNKLIDHWRRIGRRPQLVLDNDSDRESGSPLDWARSTGPDPRESMRRKETMELILGQIDRLDDKYRSVLYLRLIGGQSTEEVAQGTGLTLNSVRIRLFRGVRMLRKALKKFGIGFE